jgi:LAO/AO transport system kinase
LRRDRDAVPEALNLLDDHRPGQREAALALLDALESKIPRSEAKPSGEVHRDAPRVGLTGAPGSGKSTLLDALVRALRDRNETVGIVAVDPSSRVSGGALLGDRARVRAGAGDRGVFLRSMAARERLGGLADATWPSVAVLAAVFDRVFVETVGVGQSEAEVAGLVDTLVFVAQPGAGDVLQFMKAGILEHPDVFAVNKADLGAVAERTASELQAALAMSARDATGWQRPVLLVSARDGRGVGELVAVLDAHRAHLVASGALAERRKRARSSFVLDALERRYGSFGIERLGGREAVRARLLAEPEGGGNAFGIGLASEIETALGKSR